MSTSIRSNIQKLNKIPQFIQSRRGEIIRSALAEFIGTAVLVAFGTGTCNNETHILAIALAFGLTVTILAATLGRVSGCHINPAVTLGLFITGKISLLRSCAYVSAQILGGIAGSGYIVLSRYDGKACVTHLAHNHHQATSELQGIAIEILIISFLVFVVCNQVESNSSFAPFTIGLTVVVGHLLAIPLTGASMNIARTFGPALVSNDWGSDHYVYWIGSIAGGLVGGLIHRFFSENRSDDGEIEKGNEHETTSI